MPPEPIGSLLQAAIAHLEPSHLRSQVLRGWIAPQRQRRTYAIEAGMAHGDLWIFHVVSGGKIALAYSDEGFYASHGKRWGLVFVDSDDYGGSGGWYDSLRDLVIDLGYFQTD